MAQSKDDIKYGTAQAKVSPDESLRVAYVGGTPLESGKIADSEIVDLFPGARKIQDQERLDSRSTSQTTQGQGGVPRQAENRS
ncbi:SEED MATURATION PROTEIN 1 [Salvia hispanica]|uniref:SEED MATURATION PROTEIN 1 n=1 Tax=Salvia hispanica TaxID=49212 RepID=UPI002009AD17|nr:SEED MATURATION PROTEIN 1 [Salvia hispanica]